MIRRPIFVIGIVYFVSIIVSSFLSFNIAIGLSFIVAVMAPVGAWMLKEKIKWKISLTIMVTAAIGLASYTIKDHIEYERTYALLGEERKVEGLILTYPRYKDGIAQYDVRIERIEGDTRGNFKSVLYTSDLSDMEPFCNFEAKVEFFDPWGHESTKRYYKYRGYNVSINNYNEDEFLVSKENRDKHIIERYILDVKEYLKKNIKDLVKGYQGNLMTGMFLGDKTGISEEIKENFSRSGISYVLVVAGLHLTMMVQALYMVMTLTRINPRVRVLVGMTFIIFFVAIVGFPPSAVRAGIMNIIYLVGFLIDREADSLTSLGLGLIIILAFNPFAALDVGLQLSFFATIGIIMSGQKLYYPVYRFLKKMVQGNRRVNLGRSLEYVIKLIANTVAMSVATTLFTAPVTMLQFGHISIIAPVTNVLVVPMLPIVIVSTMLTGLLGGVPWLSIVYKLSGLLGSVGVTIITGIAGIMASLSIASVSICQKYLYIWLICNIILIIVYKYIIKNKAMIKYACVFSLIIFLAGRISNDVVMNGVLMIGKIGSRDSANKLLVTQGEATAVWIEEDEYFKTNLRGTLKNMGARRLNMLVVSGNIDLEDVKKVYRVQRPRKIYVNGKEVEELNKMLSGLKEKEGRECKVRPLTAGRINLNKISTIDIVNNDKCLKIYVTGPKIVNMHTEDTIGK